jgi:hypothetical protein
MEPGGLVAGGSGSGIAFWAMRDSCVLLVYQEKYEETRSELCNLLVISANFIFWSVNQLVQYVCSLVKR